MMELPAYLSPYNQRIRTPKGPEKYEKGLKLPLSRNSIESMLRKFQRNYLPTTELIHQKARMDSRKKV